MEAYLKKLCFEYQVDEREVKELLARMEMVYLDKGETIASATLPEQSLYIIVSGILHTYTTHEGEERTNRFFSAGDAVSLTSCFIGVDKNSFSRYLPPNNFKYTGYPTITSLPHNA